MKKIVAIEIHDISCPTPKIYVAKNRKDCLDSVDMDVYDLVMEHKDEIMMGFVFGKPIWE